MEIGTNPPLPVISPSLDELAEDMHAARDLVAALRLGAVSAPMLLSARIALLAAMEAYALELTAQRLPIPPRLRDDLRLQRHVRREESRGR